MFSSCSVLKVTLFIFYITSSVCLLFPVFVSDRIRVNGRAAQNISPSLRGEEEERVRWSDGARSQPPAERRGVQSAGGTSEVGVHLRMAEPPEEAAPSCRQGEFHVGEAQTIVCSLHNYLIVCHRSGQHQTEPAPPGRPAVGGSDWLSQPTDPLAAGPLFGPALPPGRPRSFQPIGGEVQ